MKRYFLCWMLFFFTANIYAHQPDVSTTLLSQQANDQWIIQVKAALTAFKYEVISNYGETYTTPEEFEELVIQHVRKNLSIVFDDHIKVTLQKPFVRLGHESNVAFEVVGIPKNFKSIQFTNTSFKDITRNQSALVVLKEGFSHQQFVLNHQNDHTANLTVKGNKLIALTSNSQRAFATPSIFFCIIFMGIVGSFLILRTKEKKPTLFFFFGQ